MLSIREGREAKGGEEKIMRSSPKVFFLSFFSFLFFSFLFFSFLFFFCLKRYLFRDE
jgi:hypothetical protein